jgi:hypothetical protein
MLSILPYDTNYLIIEQKMQENKTALFMRSSSREEFTRRLNSKS